MTRLAAFLVPTHHRPRLLRACLARLRAQDVPDGWDYTIVVAATPDDGAFPLGLPDGSRMYFTLAEGDAVGAKLTRALRATTADLVLVTGDDDLQPPTRLKHAVAAYEAGHRVSGVRRFWFCETATGKVARWEGDPMYFGSGLNWDAALLRSVEGWDPVQRSCDTRLREKFVWAGHDVRAHELPDEVGNGTVCLQHGGNIWQRPFPDQGVTMRLGNYTITGMGTTETAEGFPKDALEGLSP